MWLLRKIFGKPQSCDEVDLQREREEQRKKDDIRRRLHLLQAEVDVMKRHYG